MANLCKVMRYAWGLLLACAATVSDAQGGAAVRSDPLGPVGMDYFGLVLNRSEPGQPWPDVKFGSWRIWDAYVTWPYLQPARDEWRFDALDRMVDEAEKHGVKVLLVLAHSPAWASARPNEPSGYKPGFAAEPRQMEDWQNYVETVTRRYKGRIEAYQIWNEPSDKSHYSGSLEALVDMTCRARRAIKRIDPAAKVVSAGSAGPGRHIEYLGKFLASGGRECIDVVAHHFYVPRYGPEAIPPIVREVRKVMAENGVERLPLWNTETGWWIENTDGKPDHEIVTRGGWRQIRSGDELAAVIQRAFLLARGEGVERFYWYAWANPYGWGLSSLSGQVKVGGEGWNDVVDRMLSVKLESCNIENSTAECRFGTGGKMRWRVGDALQPNEGLGRSGYSYGDRPIASRAR